MSTYLYPVILCMVILLMSGCFDTPSIQADSNGSSHSPIPGTPSQAIPTVLITPNASNVQKFQSSGPAFHHPPTIFLWSLPDAIDVLGEPVFIPMELPPGYAYGTGSVNTEGVVSLVISNGSNHIRYLQVSPPRPIQGTLTGASDPATFNGTEGKCTIEGDKRQLSWSDGMHDFYLIGSMACDEFTRMAASLGPLTNETLENVPWKDLEAATPLPQSDILNLVFSREWLNAHDTNPNPQIFDIPMTVEDYHASFVPDSNDPNLLRHVAVGDEKPVALLNMPKDMFKRFNEDPSKVRINFPDSFFRFYDSMDALYEDLNNRRAGSSSTGGGPAGITPQTLPTVITTTPRLY